MHGTLSFIQNVVVGSSEDNGTGPFPFTPLELDHFVFSNHDFFYYSTKAECVTLTFGIVESTENVSSGDCTQSLDSVEIGVFNAHDSVVCEQLLGLVVNELSIDEDVWLI